MGLRALSIEFAHPEATWEGFGFLRHLLFVAKSLRPLTAFSISRLGRSERARVQLSCRTDGQGNRVAFLDGLPDVRPENRRHGAGLFSHLSSKLVKMPNRQLA